MNTNKPTYRPRAESHDCDSDDYCRIMGSENVSGLGSSRFKQQGATVSLRLLLTSQPTSKHNVLPRTLPIGRSDSSARKLDLPVSFDELLASNATHGVTEK